MILRHDYRNIDMLHYVTGDLHVSGRVTSNVSKSAKQSTKIMEIVFYMPVSPQMFGTSRKVVPI